eukprot:TRINITY_DN2139_c0_g1_i1.p1 TRINITY_DN2139_c0_g1~~TRINITY_DN2139_c0_g1_i1.p1  ORF type:complete len:325 (-),score=64.00 TRINITY_DN2139_c0_g1_i1:54-1028(-)
MVVGPFGCRLFEAGFAKKIKDIRTQIWLALWVLLVFLSIVYFIVQCEKISYSHSSTDYALKLDGKNSIEIPSWTICSRRDSVVTGITCTLKMGGDYITLNSTEHNNTCHSYNLNTVYYATRSTSNNGGDGKINCVISFEQMNKTEIAQVYIHDKAIATGDYAQLFRSMDNIPTGVCTARVSTATQSVIYWQKQIFEYSHNTQIGYSRIDFDEYPYKADPTMSRAFVSILPGDFFEWRHVQLRWYSGYDFWYFVGMNGGFLFICFLLHTGVYNPAEFLINAKEEEENKLVAVRERQREMDEGKESSSGVGSSSGGFANKQDYGSI